MPLISSTYLPSAFFRNGHAATIYSGLFRKVTGVYDERERLELPDGDFIDLDWRFAPDKSDTVVILLHGLEGSSQRPYMTASAQQFNAVGIDACAINFRGCSGEPNRLYRSYHSGASEDLKMVIEHLVATKAYTNILLKGFSLGGNLALKYLGEGNSIPKEIKAAVAISVPCDLYSSLIELLKPKNFLYARRFKKHLKGKLREKQQLFPERISEKEIKSIKTLKDFDDTYTSKAHGFKDAMDYYQRCSCNQFLDGIGIPTLLINAQNDSFLGPGCYPTEAAERNAQLYLEIPKYGGHVGFYAPQNSYYTEKRALNFVEEVV